MLDIKDLVLEMQNTTSELKSINSITYKNKYSAVECIYKNIRFILYTKNDENSSMIHVVWDNKNSHFRHFMKNEISMPEKENADTIKNTINMAFDIIEKYGDFKVSVIIPFYNREKKIVKLIESLKKQTLNKNEFEVVFIDDGSSDKSVSAVKQYAEGLNYTLVERPFSSGAASLPRNEGIRCAHGKYLMFVDSDDYIHEDTLLDAVTYANNNNSDIVYLRMSKDTESFFAGDNIPDADVFEHLLMQNGSPCKLFKTSLIRDNNIYFDQSFEKGEDRLFVITALTLANKISMLREKDYYIIVDDGSPSLSKKKENNPSFRFYKFFMYSFDLIYRIDNDTKKEKMLAQLYTIFLKMFAHNILKNKYKNKTFKDLKDVFERFNSYFLKKDIAYMSTINIEKAQKLKIFFTNPSSDDKKISSSPSTPPKSSYRNETEISKGNRIVVIRKDGTRTEVSSFPKLEVEFKGKCGLIELYENVKIKNKIKVFIGNKAFLHLSQNVVAESPSLNLSAENTTMWVGERSWLRNLKCICNAEPNIEIIMGKDIVMSLDVLFRPSDGHTIFDIASGLPINTPSFGIHIADHVWLGHGVTCLKDCSIPHDCIVGAHSVVGRKEFESNSIIAGIPAKTIRTGVSWDKKRIHEYMEQFEQVALKEVQEEKKHVSLFYWSKEINGKFNFGDVLSKYVVEKTSNASVKPAIASDKNKICGIGSIINDVTLKAGSVFWGTGTHHPKLNYFNTNPDFRAVRGPQTRRILMEAGYKCPEIYGDPALLMPEFYPKAKSSRYKLGVVSHYVHRKALNKSDDVFSIDILRTEAELMSFIDDLCQCDFILSSSLHGIILANAYGIPARWFQVDGIPLAQGGNLKFIDYFESVKMPVQTPLIFTKETRIDENFVWDISKTVDLDIDLGKLKKAFPFEMLY